VLPKSEYTAYFIWIYVYIYTLVQCNKKSLMSTYYSHVCCYVSYTWRWKILSKFIFRFRPSDVSIHFIFHLAAIFLRSNHLSRERHQNRFWEGLAGSAVGVSWLAKRLESCAGNGVGVVVVASIGWQTFRRSITVHLKWSNLSAVCTNCSIYCTVNYARN
jgi:hypothetical protein